VVQTPGQILEVLSWIEDPACSVLICKIKNRYARHAKVVDGYRDLSVHVRFKGLHFFFLVDVCIHIYTCVHLYMHTYVYMNISHIYAYVHVYMHIHVRIYISVDTDIYTHTYICIYLCTGTSLSLSLSRLLACLLLHARSPSFSVYFWGMRIDLESYLTQVLIYLSLSTGLIHL